MKMTTMVQAICLLFVTLMCAASARSINLVTPMNAHLTPLGYTGVRGPTGRLTRDTEVWKLFDGRKGSSWSRTEAGSSLGVYYSRQWKLAVNKYAIKIDKRVPATQYPTNWVLYGVNSDGSRVALDHVTGGSFENGKYTRSLIVSAHFRRFELVVTEDGTPANGEISITMSEIELIGGSRQFALRFPSGFTCRKSLELLTPKNGPKDVFSSPAQSRNTLRSIFGADQTGHWIHFTGDEPVVVGAVFAEPTKVLQYRVDTRRAFVEGGFELQGSACESGCDWTTVSAVADYQEWKTDVFAVDTPDYFKAYRLVVFKADTSFTILHNVFLLGCRATATLPTA